MSNQQSSIDLLPDLVREKLNAMLDDRKITQKDAVERINVILAEMKATGELDDASPEKLSKSSVNRYDMQMREVGAKLRQSREVADRWIRNLGAAPQGQIGNLINEMLRTVAFDLTLHAGEEGITAENAPAIAGIGKDLSLMMMRLEKAANLNVEREKEIRKQALADAADTVEEAARQMGQSEEDAMFWRKKVLGAG